MFKIYGKFATWKMDFFNCSGSERFNFEQSYFIVGVHCHHEVISWVLGAILGDRQYLQ